MIFSLREDFYEVNCNYIDVELSTMEPGLRFSVGLEVEFWFRSTIKTQLGFNKV